MPGGWSRETAERFLESLSYSDPASIDAFLGRRQHDVELGKYLIARELKQRENLDALFPPSDAGWYRYLFDRLLSDGEPRFERSALSVVTFNYDRSLEAYIHTRLREAFGMSEEGADSVRRSVPIIHVHGTLGEYPRTPYSTEASPEEVLTISRQIQIIHEISEREDDFCNDAFREAHDLIISAERIYFLGFGFHQENVRRFRAFSPDQMAGKKIQFTTSGLGTIQRKALCDTLAPLGIPSNGASHYMCNEFFSYDADL